jgi:undecaprenyl-diphosphatase
VFAKSRVLRLRDEKMSLRSGCYHLFPKSELTMIKSVTNKILQIDRSLSACLQLPRQGSLRLIAVIIAHTGDSLTWATIAVVLWYRGERFLPGVIAIAVLIIAAAVLAIKVTVRRRRPTGERSLATMTLDEHSFPSGHAARSIGLAIVLGTLYPYLLLYLIVWAVLVGVARIALGVHYLSDVIVGWGLGGLIGAVLMRVI